MNCLNTHDILNVFGNAIAWHVFILWSDFTCLFHDEAKVLKTFQQCGKKKLYPEEVVIKERYLISLPFYGLMSPGLWWGRRRWRSHSRNSRHTDSAPAPAAPSTPSSHSRLREEFGVKPATIKYGASGTPFQIKLPQKSQRSILNQTLLDLLLSSSLISLHGFMPS